MRETENERRFKRDMTLQRVQAHLDHRMDCRLPIRAQDALARASLIVWGIRFDIAAEERMPKRRKR